MQLYTLFVENNLVYNDHTQNDKIDGGFTLIFVPLIIKNYLNKT
jgi:hypothetical protein